MRLIQSLASKELVRNLPKLKFDQHFFDACKMGKQAHASHKAKNIVSTTRLLELLHMDLFGPSIVQSYGGNRYTLVIADDYSRPPERCILNPNTKTSPLVDDDLDEDEAIKITEKKNLENDIVDATLDIDEIFNNKESKNHPLENVIGNLNKKTLRSQAQNQIPQPRNMKIIGTKWVFRNKLDENDVVSRNKARLVAQGYNQQEGINYDENSAPVARRESIRILLAYVCALDFKLFQMNVKSTFLNGFINEDDMCDEFSKILHDEFEMSMMGELNVFIGLQIKQMEDGIFFNQSKYTKEMLKKFSLKDSKPMKTPISSDTKLTKDEECASEDSTKMEWVTKQARLILPYEQKPKRDRGTTRGRHSTSSSTFTRPSSSHLNDDDDDDRNNEGTSHASTPSPIRLNNPYFLLILSSSLNNSTMNSSNASFTNPSKKIKLTIIPSRQLFVNISSDEDVTTTPSPTTTSFSPTPPNVPSKTTSTNQTSSSHENTSTSFQSKLQILPPYSYEPTSPHPLNPLLNDILDVPPRPLNAQPLQSHPSLDITLSLSPITYLDHIHDTPSPPSLPQLQSPIIGHPLYYHYNDYHGLNCICCFHYRTLFLSLRDEMNIMFAHLEYLLTTAITSHFPPPS
nr:copia protein [Tanacetum cinerariifolium]